VVGADGNLIWRRSRSGHQFVSRRRNPPPQKLEKERSFVFAARRDMKRSPALVARGPGERAANTGSPAIRVGGGRNRKRLASGPALHNNSTRLTAGLDPRRNSLFYGARGQKSVE